MPARRTTRVVPTSFADLSRRYLCLMSILLLVLLLLIVFGGLPNLGFHNYGYAPSGIGGVLLIVLVVLLLTGRM